MVVAHNALVFPYDNESHEVVQQYSQYSCTRIGQWRLYCSTAVQHSTAVQQYSISTAVQRTAVVRAPLCEEKAECLTVRPAVIDPGQ